jgi:hypothetical protein
MRYHPYLLARSASWRTDPGILLWTILPMTLCWTGALALCWCSSFGYYITMLSAVLTGK